MNILPGPAQYDVYSYLTVEEKLRQNNNLHNSYSEYTNANRKSTKKSPIEITPGPSDYNKYNESGHMKGVSFSDVFLKVNLGSSIS